MVPALQRYHRAPGFLRRNLPAQPPATLTLGNGREHTAETIFALWARGKSEHTVRAHLGKGRTGDNKFFAGLDLTRAGVCDEFGQRVKSYFLFRF